MRMNEASRVHSVLRILLFTIFPAAGLPGQEAQIVLRRGGDIRGTIEGSVLIAGRGDIQVAGEGTVKGQLILPRDLKANTATGAEKGNVAPGVRLQQDRRSTPLDTRLDTTGGFNLPLVFTPTAPVGSRTVALENQTTSVDLAGAGNISLDKRNAEIALAPGNYGAVNVLRGALVLGQKGATIPDRYAFRTLDVGTAGEIRLVGPVVMTVGQGGTWKGKLGSADAPLWLDARIADGALQLEAPCAFHGVLLAPASTTTVANGASVVGAIITDVLIARAGAKITTVEPNWSAGADARERPRFAHKALRLERQASLFRGEFKSEYSPGVSYVEDIPYLMLGQHKRLADHPRAAQRDRWAFFQAACTLFVETNFDAGFIILTNADPTAGPHAVRNIKLERADFEKQLAALGGKSSVAENLRWCVTHPNLLERFVDHWLPPSPAEPQRS